MVLCNEGILFLWRMLFVGVEDDNGKELLDMIVKLHVTIRVFSFASLHVNFSSVQP